MLENLVFWVIPVKGQNGIKILTPENILILRKTLGHINHKTKAVWKPDTILNALQMLTQ